MKYACEMIEAIAIQTAEQEVERMKKDAEKYAKAMVEFEKNLDTIDAYVESQLLKGNGIATLMVDNDKGYSQPNGFFYFAEKDTRYGLKYPYWYNDRKTSFFPLALYVKYLEDHCYKVEVEKHPFIAYSSTGKSHREMEGLHLKISIDCPV